MKITYIHHSCYAVEFERFSLLFDFYRDALLPDGSYWVKNHLLETEQHLYVFCSHSHADHLNTEILDWKRKKGNISYIFSKEILAEKNISDENIIYLDKLHIYQDANLRVKAFGSTDAGGSFLVEAVGKRIFHAGDLNNWHWNEEVGKEEALAYENNFLCEVELLAEEVERLNVAMFPIDPRLGRDYMRGAEQFLQRIPTDYLLPMHFGENYDKANAFAPFAHKHNCRYLAVERQGQSFSF